MTIAGGEAIQPGMHVCIGPQRGPEFFLEVHPDGSFNLDTLSPGDYNVSVTTAQGFPYALMQIEAQGARVRGHNLQAGNQPIRLHLNVSGATTIINGIAQRGVAPVSGVFVALVPTDLKEMHSLVQLNQSDSDGTFNFAHIPPGDYTVMAIEEGWNLDWGVPESIAPFLLGGVRLTVTGRDREVDLPSPVEFQPRHPH